jgi:hypothetical protein
VDAIVFEVGWTRAAEFPAETVRLAKRDELETSVSLGRAGAEESVSLAPRAPRSARLCPGPAHSITALGARVFAVGTDSVGSEEHRSTASNWSSVHSIGTAFGAAIAGVVANVDALGNAAEPGGVGNAAVYMFCCIPFGLAALLMFRVVHIVFGTPEAGLLADSGFGGHSQ